MRISHSHRFVFFANPKTGSRSVRSALDPYSDVAGRPGEEVTEAFPFYNHMRPSEAAPHFAARGWDFDAYFKFTLVRNPWARAVSLYEMVAFREGGQLSRLRPKAVRRRGFREWVRSIDPEEHGAAEPGVEHSIRRVGALSFAAFAGDEDGRILVDRVARLEDIERELPAIFAEIGLPPPEVPHTGRGRYSGDYRAYYDDESRDWVGRLYADDVERFGYDF